VIGALQRVLIIDRQSLEIIATFYLDTMSEVVSMCLSNDNDKLNILSEHRVNSHSFYQIDIKSKMYEIEKKLDKISLITPSSNE